MLVRSPAERSTPDALPKDAAGEREGGRPLEPECLQPLQVSTELRVAPKVALRFEPLLGLKWALRSEPHDRRAEEPSLRSPVLQTYCQRQIARRGPELASWKILSLNSLKSSVELRK